MATNNEKRPTKSPTALEWAGARRLWEADPTKTFVDIANILGVIRQAVHRKAKREGWLRVADMEEIAQQAQKRADGLSAVAAAQNSTDAAVDLRSKLLERHRDEWKGPRTFIYAAIQNNDMEKAKVGKVIAEGLKIMQDGERKAWGLDTDKGPTSAVNVTINRK